MKISDISLQISNHFSKNLQNEANQNTGVIVGFDWVNDKLVEINTNIDLNEGHIEGFDFVGLVKFLKDNNFKSILGLKNKGFEKNPSEKWIEHLSKNLSDNDMKYSSYSVGTWPSPIPKFNLTQKDFVLRYSFDPQNRIDELASNQHLFEKFIKHTKWKKYYSKDSNQDKKRIIILCFQKYDNILLFDGKKKDKNLEDLVDDDIFHKMSLSKIIISLSKESESVSTLKLKKGRRIISAKKENGQYIGSVENYFLNGNKMSEEHLINGRVKKFKYYYSNGDLEREGEYTDGSQIKTYERDGRLKMIEEVTDANISLKAYLDDGGGMSKVETTHDGYKHKFFDKHGNLSNETYFDKNDNHLKTIMYNETQKQILYSEYSNGLKHGRHIYFFNNGQKYLDQNYNLGSLSGECVEYHDNGNVRSTGNMKVNLMDGDWIFYYRSGRIEAKCNFAMGTLMKGTNFYDTDEHKVMATF